MRDYKKQYQDLPQETKDRMACNRGKIFTPNSKVFCENSKYANEMVKGRIITQELIEWKCFECGIKDWNNNPLILEMDHINGINNDHRLENLRFLCPNCHSQTSNFRGRNKNTGLMKVSNEDLLTAYFETGNIRKALLKVGLAPKGGNYIRLKRLLEMDV